ncbi:MAG: hypothetical protein R2749_03660 [Acidimicrobiales bacterium]
MAVFAAVLTWLVLRAVGGDGGGGDGGGTAASTTTAADHAVGNHG